jgi:hypothetical protein
MNEKEQAIADKFLNSIDFANVNERQEAIYVYQSFLGAVQTRLQIEAQNIENRKQA